MRQEKPPAPQSNFSKVGQLALEGDSGSAEESFNSLLGNSHDLGYFGVAQSFEMLENYSSSLTGWQSIQVCVHLRFTFVKD